nr:c-type cytochrome biogenensis protein [Cryptomonas borealis]
MKHILTKIKQKVLYSLGNLQLAISLLLIIALISSLGTTLEQDKTQIFYETNYGKNNAIFGIINSEWILGLGLDHIYTTIWFFALITLFGASLSSCTITRQLPSLKLAKLWQFITQENYKNKNGITIKLKKASLNKLSYILRKKNYNIIQQGAYIYAYKGLIGKISPILVHIGIITILIGSITGSLTGFTIQELVPKKELFHPQNIISAGPLSYIRQNFEVYVKDFRIAYTDQGSIDQFYSDLIIIDTDIKTKMRKTIFVNEPLKYEEILFYQTDWNISRIQIQTGNKSIEKALQNIEIKNNSKLWVGPLIPHENIIVGLQDLTGKYLLYTPEKKLLGIKCVGSKIFIKGNPIRITKILPSTGLQIKSDLGTTIVYIGFLILLPNIIFSYISYSQIWGVKKQSYLYIHANTNRAIYFFEKWIFDITTILELNK